MNQTYTEEQRRQLHRLLDHAINLDTGFSLSIHPRFREDNPSLILLLASITSEDVRIQRVTAETSPTGRAYTIMSTTDVNLFTEGNNTRAAEQRRFDVA